MLRFEAKGFEPAEQRTLTLNAGREGRLYLFTRARSPFD
jgi:hypothetical protein